MHVIIVTDAWHPHLSGVLRVVESLAAQFDTKGIGYTIISPKNFPGIPMPGYSEIKLSVPLFFRKTVDTLLRRHKDAAIHIMTEGPLGLTMRNYCVARGLQFTTSFHTHWHKYLRMYLKIPQRVTMHYVRDFHRPAARVLVPSEETCRELVRHGYTNEVIVCTNGVDTTLFKIRKKSTDTRRPHMLYVGRVSKEKNIESFLKADVCGSKRVVGDGPIRRSLERKYPDVTFSGVLQGDALAAAYSNADVFVFPSKTDTFGIVVLEALASGVPVAAYPAPGPNTLLQSKKLGARNTNITTAIRTALRTGDPHACASAAHTTSWERIAQTFRDSLVPAGTPITTRRAIVNHVLHIPRGLRALRTHHRVHDGN